MPGAGGKYGGGVKLTVQLFVSKRCIETELSKSSWNGVGESRHLLYGSRGGGGGGGVASQLPRQVSYTQACSHAVRQTVTETDQRNLKKYYSYRMVYVMFDGRDCGYRRPQSMIKSQ